MTHFRLLLTFAFSTICLTASAQNVGFFNPQSPQFIRQVDYQVSSSIMDLQPSADNSATIFDDGSTVYADSPEEFFDPGALPADCGYSCPPAWTSELEGLLFTREGDSEFSRSAAVELEELDFEGGLRVTLHRHYDCLSGWDLVYAGSLEWTEIQERSGAGLNSLFAASGVNISAFNNATFHRQFLRSRLHSFELNRKWYGWDVIAAGLGVRYLKVEEDYAFSSIDGAANSGLFSVATDNDITGLQLLLEMKVPVGPWMTKARIKGGLFANVAESETALTNAGVQQFSNSDEDIEFSSLVELGYFLRYRVSPNISLQGGYEFWWLYGLSTAPDQVPITLTPNTGLSANGNGDNWYHGASAGIEIIY